MHIGKKIQEAVKRSGLSVTEFAEKINYSRRNIYSIFEKESIDTSLLFKISEVLGHDFFTHYNADAKKGAKAQAAEPSGVREYNENRIREMLKEIDYLKEINSLLKTQVDKLGRKGRK